MTLPHIHEFRPTAYRVPDTTGWLSQRFLNKPRRLSAVLASVSNNIPGTDGVIEIPDSGAADFPQRFYRVILLSP